MLNHAMPFTLKSNTYPGLWSTFECVMPFAQPNLGSNDGQVCTLQVFGQDHAVQRI